METPKLDEMRAERDTLLTDVKKTLTEELKSWSEAYDLQRLDISEKGAALVAALELLAVERDTVVDAASKMTKTLEAVDAGVEHEREDDGDRYYYYDVPYVNKTAVVESTVEEYNALQRSVDEWFEECEKRAERVRDAVIAMSEARPRLQELESDIDAVKTTEEFEAVLAEAQRRSDAFSSVCNGVDGAAGRFSYMDSPRGVIRSDIDAVAKSSARPSVTRLAEMNGVSDAVAEFTEALKSVHEAAKTVENCVPLTGRVGLAPKDLRTLKELERQITALETLDDTDVDALSLALVIDDVVSGDAELEWTRDHPGDPYARVETVSYYTVDEFTVSVYSDAARIASYRVDGEEYSLWCHDLYFERIIETHEEPEDALDDWVNETWCERRSETDPLVLAADPGIHDMSALKALVEETGSFAAAVRECVSRGDAILSAMSHV